jgi:hypothetical protein
MQGKSVKGSAVIVSQLMGPQDVNNYGYVHGLLLSGLFRITDHA